MFELVQAIVLGIVQGLTEFIPVSSKTHLILVPYLLGWERPGIAFDVALHLGTLAALLAFFRVELTLTARALLGLDRSPDGLLYRRLGVYLVVASVPVGSVGLLFEERLTALFDEPLVAALLLLCTAALLVTGERIRDARVRRAGAAAVPTPAGRAAGAAAAPDAVGAETSAEWSGPRRDSETAAPTRTVVSPAGPHRLPDGADPADPYGTSLAGVTLQQAMLVGVAQCFALLPGFSRSGTTIVAGLATGLTREAATRFSFLLSLPAIVGAAILSIGDLAAPGGYSGVAVAGGVVAGFVSGYLAIRFLVALVARDRLTGFAIYCVAASAVGVAAAVVNG